MKMKMKTMRHHYESAEDIAAIVAHMAAHDVEISESTAVLLWRRYSDDVWCAGWMGVSPDSLEELVPWALPLLEPAHD